MTPSEQREVEQALAVAEALNSAALSMPFKPSAKLQYLAHLIAALGLAAVNNVSLEKTLRTIRLIHKEMLRTDKESQKPKLSLVSQTELKGD